MVNYRFEGGPKRLLRIGFRKALNRNVKAISKKPSAQMEKDQNRSLNLVLMQSLRTDLEKLSIKRALCELISGKIKLFNCSASKFA